MANQAPHNPVPEPQRAPVKRCRCCNGRRIVDLEYAKRFYLPNLERIVEVPYAACQDCKLIFQANYVGDEFLNYYYAHSPMLRRAEVTSYETDQHRRQSEFLIRNCPPDNCRVLEIGAGSGGFLSYLKQNFACQTWFDELSVEAATTMLKIPGLQPFTPSDGLFDLLVLRHVLEHINDIDAFLDRLDLLLGEDGAIFIEVPDWSYFDKNCDPLIFEHLSQFNPRSLLTLFGRLGWTCDALEKSICASDPATPNRVLRAIFRKPANGVASAGDTAEAFKRRYLPFYDSINEKITRLLAAHPGKPLALYPASHLSHSLLIETELSSRVIGMFDIDTKKQGRAFNGVQVYAPETLEKFQPTIVLITTMAYENEIKDYLATLNISAIILGIKDLMSPADGYSGTANRHES